MQPSSGSADPLDEIGDLVGRTLDILGTATSGGDGVTLANYGSSGPPPKTGSMARLASEDLDILSGSVSALPQHAGAQGGGLGGAFVEEDLLGGVDLQGGNSHNPMGDKAGNLSEDLLAEGLAKYDYKDLSRGASAAVDDLPLPLGGAPGAGAGGAGGGGEAGSSALSDTSATPLQSNAAVAASTSNPSLASMSTSAQQQPLATGPYGGGTGGGGAGPSSSASHGPPPLYSRQQQQQLQDQDPLKVTIKEPEKVETVSSLGIKTHFVQYVVRTDSSVPGMLAEGLEVKRRFSDFDVLHKHIKQEYRGYIVPPLPEKSFIQGKMPQDDFIRLRRADLQAFIKSLTSHPVLRTSEALKIFLLHPGDLNRNPAWTLLVNPPPSFKQYRAGSSSSSANSAVGYTSLDLDGGGGSGGMNAVMGAAGVATIKAGLGSWVSWMKQNVAQMQPPKRELSEEEVMLRQYKELMQDLEKLLELAVESARALCAHQEALCSDVKELGRTFAMLSRFEEAVQAKVGQYTPAGQSAGNRANDLNKLAHGSVKQHGVWKTLSIKTAASLVTLHDYYVLVPEAIAALELREQALTHLHMLQDELVAKQQAQEQASVAANKLRPMASAAGSSAAPSAAEKRAYQLTTAISQLEEQIKQAQQDYEALKQRNQSELARLNLEREDDFRRMMVHFAQTQAELVQASADMWASVAKQYEQSC